MNVLIKEDKEMIYISLKSYLCVFACCNAIFLCSSFLSSYFGYAVNDVVIRFIYLAGSLATFLLTNSMQTESGNEYYRMIIFNALLIMVENVRILFFLINPAADNCIINYCSLLSDNIINIIQLVFIYSVFKVINKCKIRIKTIVFAGICLEVVSIISNYYGFQDILLIIISMFTIIIYICYFNYGSCFQILENKKINYLKVDTIFIVVVAIISLICTTNGEHVSQNTCKSFIQLILLTNFMLYTFSICKNVILNPYYFMFRNLYMKNESLIWLNNEMLNKNLELENTQKLLKEKESNLRNFFVSIPVPLIIVGAFTNRIIFCNKQFANMVDLDVKKIINRKLNNIIILDDIIENDATYFESKHTGTSQCFDFESKHTGTSQCFDLPFSNIKRCSFDGRYGIGYADFEMIKDSENNSYILLFTDVTSKVNSDKYVETIKNRKFEEKMKSDFLSNITHDLKTPINVIYSAMQLIESYIQKDNYEKIEIYNDISKHNCEILNDFANVIINDGNINGEYYKGKKIENIADIVANTVSLLTEYAKNKKIDLQYITSSNTINFLCNREAIQRIIINLISNAIKYCKGIGKIRVSLSDENKYISLIVKDNGIGMDNEFVKKAFCRYSMAEDKKSTTITNSNGIGLNIVKKMVEEQNGAIELKSKINQGTSFIIKFRKEESKL